jgi:phosphoribosylformylglycinamidine cyclo-ligase
VQALYAVSRRLGIFQWLQRTGDVADEDMLRTFNMGIGLIIACAAADADRLIAALHAGGETEACVIGAIERGGEGVRYVRG